MKYEEISDDGFDEFADDCEVTPIDGGVLVKGTCRRCRHATQQPIYQQLVRGGRFRARKVMAERHLGEGMFRILCQCKEDHKNRPEKKKGCGAYWRITLSRTAS